MKNMKKFVATVLAVGVIMAAGAVHAATVKTPADIASELTGKTAEQVYQERVEGKTFGTIAKDAEKLEEFKQQMMDNKKAMLDQRVAEGRLTQERADEIYNAMKENQKFCDGSGSEMIGRGNDAGFGNNQGNGFGRSQGVGKGTKMRNGNGNGTRNGRGLNR